MIAVIEFYVIKDVSKYWYRNDQRHRDNDQPAMIYPDGTKYWFQHGKYIKIISSTFYAF
jgi:hypothetical protein